MLFILSQILGVFAIAVAVLSVQSKDKTKLLLLQSLENTLKIVSLALIGGMSGAYSEIVGLGRKLWFFNNSRNKRLNGLASLLFFITLSVVVAIVSWEGVITLLPLTAVILGTLGLWQDNHCLLRYFALIASICYGTYDILVGNYALVVSEVIMIVSIIVSLVRLSKEGIKLEKNMHFFDKLKIKIK